MRWLLAVAAYTSLLFASSFPFADLLATTRFVRFAIYAVIDASWMVRELNLLFYFILLVTVCRHSPIFAMFRQTHPTDGMLFCMKIEAHYRDDCGGEEGEPVHSHTPAIAG
jgi:hypothetical protein